MTCFRAVYTEATNKTSFSPVTCHVKPTAKPFSIMHVLNASSIVAYLLFSVTAAAPMAADTKQMGKRLEHHQGNEPVCPKRNMRTMNTCELIRVSRVQEMRLSRNDPRTPLMTIMA